MLVDTHAHLNFNAYRDDADEVIRRSLANDVWMINVGSQYETSKRAVEIAEKYEKGVLAAVGLHPMHLETGLVKIKNDSEEIQIKTKEEEFNYEKYKELARSPKVVAIGETGLDYYYRPKTKVKIQEFKEKQKKAFLKQLDLAKELNLAVIFHCRVAHQDLIQTIQQSNNPTIRGVIHSFVGTKEQLQEYLKMGFYIGFNGIIFKKIEGIDFEENIKIAPLEKILLETDCPYLTPLPAVASAEASAKPLTRNEPLYVKYIAEKVAEIKKIDYQKLSEITTENARNLFKITA